mmetsp:Transcript_32014/g.77777  ORF Transcript_32014/g.77777 Transcript_32014/m.77777 type:complete len:750 (+) Transcript_32014:165-2414(+)
MSSHHHNSSSHPSDQSFDNSTMDSFQSFPDYMQSPGANSYSRNESEFSSLGFEWSRTGSPLEESTRTDQTDGSLITRPYNNYTNAGDADDDGAITRTRPGNIASEAINANTISSYNHAYIKKMSDANQTNSGNSDFLEQESKDQVLSLDSVGHDISTKSMNNELRQRTQKQNLKQQSMSRSKSVQEIMESGKRSNAIDLSTGKEGGSRSQCAIIRDDYEREPQSRRRRGYRKIIKFITRPFRQKEEVSTSSQRAQTKKQRFRDGNKITRRTVSIPNGDDTQYQIFSIDEGLGKGLKGISQDRRDKGKLMALFNAEKMVTSYLFWAFRSSFIAVLMSAALWFGGITFAFGGVMFFLAHRAPTCLHVAGKDFDGQFMDAYSMSWTTFTTVGYGAVYPGTTATSENVNHCWAVTILATVEAFVGILFASFWGAIFLSKVTRVSSSAQVTFSDPVLIRFGDGVKGTQHNDDDSSESESEAGVPHEPHAHNYPCPILEFRLINKLAMQRKGEIIDASLNMVASVDPSQVPNMNAGNSRKKKKGKKGKGRKAASGSSGARNMEDFDGRPSEEEKVKSRLKIRKILIQSEKSIRGAEVNDPGVANRREFAKLYVESQDHPFFKRVWVARHVLDSDSPLLINDAKDLIRLNGGRWPAELNNASAVRACVKFDQILVSLSGTSNADANTVYAQKIYDFSNVVVGYRFCNILYREVDGSLGVDTNLLNDVLEQSGGGGEELDERMRFSFRQSKMDILIL